MINNVRLSDSFTFSNIRIISIVQIVTDIIVI